DGDSLTAVVMASPAHGTVNLLENGQFTYTSDADYLGSDSFTYRAYDGQAYSAPAIVSINVLPIDDDFVASGDSFNIPSGLTLHDESLGLLTSNTTPHRRTDHALLAEGPGRDPILAPDHFVPLNDKSA